LPWDAGKGKRFMEKFAEVLQSAAQEVVRGNSRDREEADQQPSFFAVNKKAS